MSTRGSGGRFENAFNYFFIIKFLKVNLLKKKTHKDSIL